MNNFWKRAITGIVYAITILASIYIQCHMGYHVMTTLFAVFNALGLYEFYHITNKSERIHVPVLYLIISGTILYYACVLTIIDSNFCTPFVSKLVLFVYMMSVIALYIYELLAKEKAPTHNIAFALTGHVSITIPFSLLTAIGEYDYNFIFAMFVLTWVFDTFAYLVGSTLGGKYKLLERVSPKKSWAGEIGGMTLTLIASGIFYMFKITCLSLYEWLIFGALVVIFGTLGDLIESLMKRSANVKDSGNILPGHGGILDRLDSILLISPIMYIFVQIISEIK